MMIPNCDCWKKWVDPASIDDGKKWFHVSRKAAGGYHIWWASWWKACPDCGTPAIKNKEGGSDDDTRL
jgi:hypothetical protein